MTVQPPSRLTCASPGEILEHLALRGLLDLSQPAALLLVVAVLHFFPDAEAPAALVAELRDALTPEATW